MARRYERKPLTALQFAERRRERSEPLPQEYVDLAREHLPELHERLHSGPPILDEESTVWLRYTKSGKRVIGSVACDWDDSICSDRNGRYYIGIPSTAKEL